MSDKKAQKKNLSEAQKLRYDRWVAYKNLSDQQAGAAAARRNTALITISGGGLYVILEEMRHIQMNHIEVNGCTSVLLGIAGLSFIIALIANFFMFFDSLKVNNNDSRYSVIEINAMFRKSTSEELEDKQKIDCNAKTLNLRIRRLRRVDTWAMLIGVTLLALSSAVVFYST